jgi:hypothetical protein
MTNRFREVQARLADELRMQLPIHTGEWQAMDTSKSSAHATYELTDVTLTFRIPPSMEVLADDIGPDLPWAEDHFDERVSGVPHNPPPSHRHWPQGVGANAAHMTDGVFSHSYPERFWPRHDWTRPNEGQFPGVERQGIRYRYGDLSDVVALLHRSPYTRQAFLPVWFPEDTGAHHRERVPCTLGYHFMIRDNPEVGADVLTCRYYIRSCDAVRHLHNDVYLAGRLMQWLVGRLNAERRTFARDDLDLVHVDQLTIYIASLHAFVGDRQRLKELAQR